MSYLYSLYDALVSINVPSDKARAVVDAIEVIVGTLRVAMFAMGAADLTGLRSPDVIESTES